MQLKEIMTPNPECISPGESLQAAAQRMRELDVGPLPVCDNDRLAGMLTDRDITIRAVAEGKDPRTTTVREVMTPDIVYCFDDQDVNEAASIMRERQLRRMLVLNRNKRLVGIVALGDLAVDTDDRAGVGAVLQDISEPSIPLG